MAHVGEDPKLHNTGVRGVDTVMRNLASIFGPRVNKIMDPHALHKHSAYLLPHSYVDSERYLTTTFINAMDQMPDWWRQVAGVIDETELNIVHKIWVQKRVIAQYTAPGAPADISEQTQEIRNYSLQRIQTDFKFENENFQFGGEDGMKEVTMKLGAVKAAVEAAYIRQILESLFFEKDWYRTFKARYGTRSVRTVQDAVRWVQDATFFIQKGGLRMWAEIFGLVRDAIIDAGGMEPNVWIVPNGVKLKSSIQAYDAVEYSRRGQLIFPHLEKLDKSLDIFHGVKVVESGPIKVENEREPVDPLRGVLRTGNYFLMRANAPGVNLRDYKTYKRDVLVYSHDTDSDKTRVTLQQVLPHVHRWDSDGYLSGDHYALAANLRQEMLNMGFLIPEDRNETIQADMFIYKDESGDYRVADIFGHQESFYLDSSDVREMVETGYNSFDKVLTEDDKRALAQGEKLKNDLFNYDMLSPAAAVFRHAILLSNPNVDSNTGLAEPNMFGFARNMPVIETNAAGEFVLRVAGTDQYVTYAAPPAGSPPGTLGQLGTGDLAAAYSQGVRFMPYGMGSIPGMRTLAEIARAPTGSVGRLGYDDAILDIARDYDIALVKIYNEMVNHFGEDHISLSPDNLPEFFKGPVPLNNSITLFAAQHMDTPKYPFFMEAPGAIGLSPEDRTLIENLRQNINQLRDAEAASFLRSFLANDESFREFRAKLEDIYEVSLTEFYNRFLRDSPAERVAKVLNQLVEKFREEQVTCTGITDGTHSSMRLVVSRNEFFREEVWNAGLRPRNVSCPHSIFRDEQGVSDVTAFRQDAKNSGNVAANDVLGTYVVNAEVKPYSPDIDSLGPITGMDVEPMDFSMFNAGKIGDATGSGDDKSYTGATSSNLERKYREISNRYSSLTVHRAYGQMVLLAQTTYHQFMRFLQNDVVFPAEIAALRPEIEYEVKAVIPIRGGGETVNIHRAASNFLFENRGIARETAASFAQYMLAIVRDTRNYTIINAGWCERYVRGEGLDPLNHDNMNVVSGEFGGSVLYTLQPYRASLGRPGLRTKLETVQFLTGRLDETYWDAQVAEDLSYAGYKWGSRVRPNAVYESYIFDLDKIAAQMHLLDQTHMPNQTPPVNNLILKTQWIEWNDGAKDYSTVIENEDIFGKGGVYTGCGKDRDGNLFRCAHARDNCP